ncbi:MAG: outer membrane protein assembly factor BamD [Bryobacteraceae bacterium]|jgi:outer membrane protein assembly factor BamD
MARNAIRNAAALAAALVLLTSCFHKRKYENPITKETQQPDKILFDKAIDDIEHSRYSVARLTLQTLMNTYDTSEYLAKAKLATADSWYREGGSSGLAQAESEYKDFILFYPTMEEAAEAQEKVCDIHYEQMEKADRDPMHALRAEDECRQVLVQFPNSAYASQAEQRLRQIQENEAEAEYRVGMFYQNKGNNFAAANRLQTLVDNFPLYSKAGDSAWSAAESWSRLGDRFEKQEIAQLTRLVRDYPLSQYVDLAKTRLQALNAPIPQADAAALARMQYESQNRTKRSFMSNVWGGFSGHPDLSAAAKSGTPQMQGMRPTIPANVPPLAAGTLGTSGDITVSVPGDASALENNPDARAVPPGQASAGGGTPGEAGAPGAAAPPGEGTPQAAATPPATTAQPQAKGNAKNQKKAKAPKPPKPPKKTKVSTQQQTPASAPASAPPSGPPASGGDAPPKQ